MSFSELTLETTVIAAKEQVACEVGDEMVVLSLKDGVYYALNPVAVSIWKALQEEQRKVMDIRDMLMREYEVDRNSCTNDLFALLAQLIEWRLVEIANGKVQGKAK